MKTARHHIILLAWLVLEMIELAFAKSPTHTP
jgi:hypothetical protein